MTLTEMSITGGILIGATLILRLFTKKRLPKITFVVLWCIAILRLLVPYSLESALSVYTVAEKYQVIQQEQVENYDEIEDGNDYSGDHIDNSAGEDADAWVDQPVDIPVVRPSVPEGNTPVVPGDNTPVIPEGNESPVIIPDEPITVPVEPDTKLSAEDIWGIAKVVWLAGCIICTIYFIVAYVNLRVELAASLPETNEVILRFAKKHKLIRRVEIRRSDRITTPITYGLFKPVIVMPKISYGCSEHQLEYIIEHEHVHIKRMDILVKGALIAAVCVHWFNPLVWVMLVLCNRDLELSCDEAVIRKFGKDSCKEYAYTLLGFEERRRGLSSLTSGFSKNAIEERIKSIMKLKKLSVFAIIAAVLLIAVVFVVFATSSKKDDDVPGGFETGDVETEAPETEPPATEPPITEPPVTEPPVTEAPATEPPVTEPPVTEPPVTEPPVTEPPATEPPVTEPPVTEPPVTEPPVTEAPVTEPPVTEPPVTEAPVTEPPVTKPVETFAPTPVPTGDYKFYREWHAPQSYYSKTGNDSVSAVVSNNRNSVFITAEKTGTLCWYYAVSDHEISSARDFRPISAYMATPLKMYDDFKAAFEKIKNKKYEQEMEAKNTVKVDLDGYLAVVIALRDEKGNYSECLTIRNPGLDMDYGANMDTEGILYSDDAIRRISETYSLKFKAESKGKVYARIYFDNDEYLERLKKYGIEDNSFSNRLTYWGLDKGASNTFDYVLVSKGNEFTLKLNYTVAYYALISGYYVGIDEDGRIDSITSENIKKEINYEIERYADGRLSKNYLRKISSIKQINYYHYTIQRSGIISDGVLQTTDFSGEERTDMLKSLYLCIQLVDGDNFYKPIVIRFDELIKAE